MSYYNYLALRKKAFKKIESIGKESKIFVDVHEKNSSIGNELSKWGLEVSYYNLSVGDYVISKKCAIERKTFSDYCISLNNERLFKQVIKLCSSFF